MKSIFRMLGLILLLGGIANVIYYYAFFETTIVIDFDGGTRVHNIGLMNIRTDSMIFYAFIVIVGAVLIFLGRDATKGINKTKQRCRKCGELISIQARECIHCGQSAIRLNNRR